MQFYFGHIYLPKNNKIQFNPQTVEDCIEEEYELIEGVRLFMDGDEFWIETAARLFGLEQYHLIVGAFTSLGYVSLLECNVIGTSNGIGGYETKIGCRYILTGVKIQNVENLKFTQLSVTMPSLRNWFDKTIFNEINIFEGNIKLVKHNTVHLIDFDTFSLEVAFGINQNLNRETGLKINDSVVLRIKTTEDRLSIWELIERYKKFKNFIAFIGIFDKCEDKFTFFDKDIKYENLDELVAMNFYCKQYNFKNNGVDAIKKVNYDFIQNDIESILHKWYNLNDLSDSIDLILEKYFQGKLSTDSFFLNSCFAIETYHRRFKGNKRYPKAEFRKIKNEILAKIENEEVKTFFNDKLAHANEPSFRERLQSLDEDFQTILPLETDIDHLIKRIVKTRNFIVHRDSSEDIIKGLELFYTSFYLEALTKLCIFKELGFSKEHIQTMFSNSRYQIESMYNLNKRLQSGINK